ncbi:MAG: D-alanyl-D-alanine carboxypeptidase [Actinomycetota bacterium]
MLLFAALASVLAAAMPGAQAGGALDAAEVSMTMGSTTVASGGCTTTTISVDPDKTGQQVQLQRRTREGWRTLSTAVLGSGSTVTLRRCFGWSDLGSVRLRARWPKQDASNATGIGPVRTVRVVRAKWMRRVDRLVRGRAIGVSVGVGTVAGNPDDDAYLYRRADGTRRTPASNEKLLLSMAALERFGSSHIFPTKAAATGAGDGVVGNLWILGTGDPEVGGGRMHVLAHRLRDAGLRRVRGRVLGSTGGFRRDWWAKGWKRFFPDVEIPLPTALTWRGNRVRGHHIRDPERRAAAALTQELRRAGIVVKGRPGAGKPPGGLPLVAQARSPVLSTLLRHQNVHSRNFFAEVLGKALGADRFGHPGTIRKGARAIEAFGRTHGVRVRSFDSSGLSYANRVAPGGIVRLLWAAEEQPWLGALRSSLPAAGQGTLRGRLRGVTLRAKTGTLTDISALSGWVWLEQEDRWATFSILSRGMRKDTASGIEDRIVRAITGGARVPD